MSHKFKPGWLTLTRIIGCALTVVMLTPGPGHAEALWHCSRAPGEPANTAAYAGQEEFKLSSFDAVSVTLQDLLDVYLGRDVKVGPYPLMACFMPGDDALSIDALQSLGLKSQVMQKLAARSSIVQSHLHMVHDEAQMLACMERHFPAFGYFSKEIVTEKVVPCF